MDEDFEPTPEGLLRCLQVLSEEAAQLSLSRTFAALQEAIAICGEETDTVPLGGRVPLAAGLIH